MQIKKNIAISESGFLFDSNSGDSYSLNETGKTILNLIQEHKSEEEIISYFTENYDVHLDLFEMDLNDFLITIEKMNLLVN